MYLSQFVFCEPIFFTRTIHFLHKFEQMIIEKLKNKNKEDNRKANTEHATN